MRRGAVHHWLMGISALLVLALLLPIIPPHSDRGPSPLAVCQTNLKQLGTAFSMYQQDYDEQFPPTARWRDVTMPYTKNTRLYDCPALKPGEHGYAMNGALEGLSKNDLRYPKNTPLLFDSAPGRPDASDPLQSFTRRHERGTRGWGSVAFADGHVEALQAAPPAMPR